MRKKYALIFAVLFCLFVPLGCGRTRGGGVTDFGDTCVVQYDPNGGSGGVKSVTVEKDVLLTPPDSPTRTDYGFDGWFTGRADGERWRFETDKPTRSMTLYAHWYEDAAPPEDELWCFVYFHKTDLEAFKIRRGEPAPHPTNPVREGYRFDGWYSELACLTPFDFKKTVTQDTVVYAQWTKLDIPVYYVVPVVSGRPDYAGALKMGFNVGQTVQDEFYYIQTFNSDDVTAGFEYIIANGADASAATQVYWKSPGVPYKLGITGRVSFYFSYEYDYDGKGAPTSVATSAHDLADTKNLTYYFTDNTFSTGKVYAYCYDSKSTPTAENAAFPGMSASYVRKSSSGKTIYSFTVPAGKYDTVIFNDGASGGAKTPKILITGKPTGSAYYLEGSALREYVYVW